MPRIIEGREVVVRARGENWSFTLPHGHDLEIKNQQVSLSMGYASSLYTLVGTSDADPEELIVSIGDRLGTVGPGGVGDFVPEPTGYSIPTIDEEIQRLEARCSEARGDWQRISAWAAGDTYESRLRRIRGELRRLEAAPVGANTT